MILALITLALSLAIAYFYMTKKRADREPADAVTKAAESADNAARVVGEAARNAAGALDRHR